MSTNVVENHRDIFFISIVLQYASSWALTIECADRQPWTCNSINFLPPCSFWMDYFQFLETVDPWLDLDNPSWLDLIDFETVPFPCKTRKKERRRVLRLYKTIQHTRDGDTEIYKIIVVCLYSTYFLHICIGSLIGNLTVASTLI